MFYKCYCVKNIAEEKLWHRYQWKSNVTEFILTCASLQDSHLHHVSCGSGKAVLLKVHAHTQQTLELCSSPCQGRQVHAAFPFLHAFSPLDSNTLLWPSSFKISLVGPLSLLFLILASSLVLKIPFKITICGQFFRPTWEVESHFQNISPDAGRERLFKKNITINKTKSLVCQLITYIQYLAYFQYIELQPLNSNNLLKALGLAKGGSFAVFSEGLLAASGSAKSQCSPAPKQCARGQGLLSNRKKNTSQV